MRKRTLITAVALALGLSFTAPAVWADEHGGSTEQDAAGDAGDASGDASGDAGDASGDAGDASGGCGGSSEGSH